MISLRITGLNNLYTNMFSFYQTVHRGLEKVKQFYLQILALANFVESVVFYISTNRPQRQSCPTFGGSQAAARINGNTPL